MSAESLPNPIFAEPETDISTEKIPLSSGNYLIDTLYLYSRILIGDQTNKDDHDLCINALNIILTEADTNGKLLNLDPLNAHIQDNNSFFVEGDDKLFVDENKAEVTRIVNIFFTAFERLDTNLFDLENSKLIKIEDLINKIDLHNDNDSQKFPLNDINILATQFRPSQVYEKLANKLSEGNPSYTPSKQHIQTTFDYVLFLFSLSIAKNWHTTHWIVYNEPKKTNLKRRNFMIISFLSIFLAYFKPILDALVPNSGSRLHTEYTQIITFINQLIVLHNCKFDNEDDLVTNPLNTYNINKEESKQKSIKNNTKTINKKQYDKSYDLLDNYNNVLIGPRQVPQNSLILNELQSSDVGAKNKTEILLPELPSAAAWQPVLTRKLGIAGVEINKVLNDINLNMCKSEIGLTSSKTQFKVTGIPFAGYDYIRNYLFAQQNNDEIIETDGNFSMLGYFDAILGIHKIDIGKFRILTAINNHYDQIYLTNVGSFDFHMSLETYKTVIVNCKSDSKFKFITGLHAYPKNTGFAKFFKNIADLQASHRVMLIYDMNPINEKIYYFEPFGVFYPVYDIYGRQIHDMQEQVIANRLYKMLEPKTDSDKSLLPKVIRPYIKPSSAAEAGAGVSTAPTYCNTGIFNLSRAAYLGHGNPYNSIINSVINSTTLHDNKTLDWVSGYCGLIIIFMMVMVKINCDMPANSKNTRNNNRTVDDIFIWLGEFNSNPFNTYDNLLSRFILRGFGRLVENILNGKQQYIQPIIFDLNDNNIQANFKVDSHGKLVNELNEHFKQTTTTTHTNNILYNILGLNHIRVLANDTQISAKINSVIQFMYTQISNENNGNGNVNLQIENADGTTRNLPTDDVTTNKLNAILEILKNNQKKQQQKKTKQDWKTSAIPLNTSSIFGTWISKYFRKKGKVYINPVVANNAFTEISTNPFNPNITRKIINTKPRIPRVLFINIQQQPQ